MKNSIFARFARAFLIFWHFEDVLVLSTTWNDLFCTCVDDISKWWQMFSFVPLCPKRWFQFNSRIVKTHFSSIMSLNNWQMIAESYIFRWSSRFRRRRFCLSSLIKNANLMRQATIRKIDIWGCCRIRLAPFIVSAWNHVTVLSTEVFFFRLGVRFDARTTRIYYDSLASTGHASNILWFFFFNFIPRINCNPIIGFLN